LNIAEVGRLFFFQIYVKMPVANHPFGKPILIWDPKKPEPTRINRQGLQEIFSHKKVKSRRVVIFSIIGELRRGKSFFLDYCLRFLYANVSVCDYFLRQNLLSLTILVRFSEQS
jgi:hypothetical protein